MNILKLIEKVYLEQTQLEKMCFKQEDIIQAGVTEGFKATEVINEIYRLKFIGALYNPNVGSLGISNMETLKRIK